MTHAPTHVRTVAGTRYVTALREGGSLPGIVEADDDGLYVVKFRGALTLPARPERFALVGSQAVAIW